MGDFKVIVRNNGPYRLEGEGITICDQEGRAYGLAGGGRIERIDEHGRHQFGKFSTQVVPVRLELPAGGAYVLAFRQSSRR